MRRRNGLFADLWRGFVFIVTIRAIARPYRSRRLYLAGRRGPAASPREPLGETGEGLGRVWATTKSS